MTGKKGKAKPFRKIERGYARVFCGGHILAQISLRDNPIEIASRAVKICPVCGSEVDIHGCAKHHKEGEK
jgi:hypothetical protein